MGENKVVIANDINYSQVETGLEAPVKGVTAKTTGLTVTSIKVPLQSSSSSLSFLAY